MEDKYVVLETKLGKLRGQVKQSTFLNKEYYAFQGVPFAKPPLGELRFKAPQPVDVWEGVRDALEDSNAPLQPFMFSVPGMEPGQVSQGSEDCLYLNIFFNELPHKNKSKKPVMHSIHGGGFNLGSGSTLSSGPDYLLQEDVVLVFCNYRCGAFGFLSLENDEVPGNAGLKDQTLAMKWVHDNIDSFGGDPDNITIFGLSAGGASVHYQLLSPTSKGLFHKAIIQSGFAFNPWAIQQNPLTVAITLAKTMGHHSDSAEEIFSFLQTASGDDIIVATTKLMKSKEFITSLGLLFVPSVEVSGRNPFLADTPGNIMKNGKFHKVPVIVGLSEMEGSAAGFFVDFSEELFSDINKHHEKILPKFLKLEPGSIEEKEASKAIWNFYFKDKTLYWENIKDFLVYESDVMFNVGMDLTRHELLMHSEFPVYTYLFTNHSMCICTSAEKTFPLISKLKTPETCHGADCKFLYLANMFTSPDAFVDKEGIIKHVKAWTSFASSGDPNCREIQETWTRDSERSPCFMNIGKTWVMKDGTLFADRMEFWKQLTSKYPTNLYSMS